MRTVDSDLIKVGFLIPGQLPNADFTLWSYVPRKVFEVGEIIQFVEDPDSVPPKEVFGQVVSVDGSVLTFLEGSVSADLKFIPTGEVQ